MIGTPGRPRLDRVGIVIDDKRFEEWTDYSIGNNVFNPSDSFSLRTGPINWDIRNLILPGHELQIYFGDGSIDNDHEAFTGWIETYSDSLSKGDESIDIAGRDKASDLIENIAPQDFNPRGLTFLEMATVICEPFGIGIRATNEANALTIANKKKAKRILNQQDEEDYDAEIVKALKEMGESTSDTLWKNKLTSKGIPRELHPPIVTGVFKKKSEAMPQDDEDCWSFLMRYAARLEIHMWMSGDGNLILQRPRYDQDPAYAFIYSKNDPSNNNVLERTYTVDISGLPTYIYRTGRSIGSGAKRQRLQSFVGSHIFTNGSTSLGDNTIGIDPNYSRVKWSKDTQARNQDELDRRTYYAMLTSEMGAIAIDVTVRGHDQDGVLYVPDRMARFKDEALDIDGLYYVASCRYDLDSKSPEMRGQVTTMTLLVPGIWAPKS